MCDLPECGVYLAARMSRRRPVRPASRLPLPRSNVPGSRRTHHVHPRLHTDDPPAASGSRSSASVSTPRLSMKAGDDKNAPKTKADPSSGQAPGDLSKVSARAGTRRRSTNPRSRWFPNAEVQPPTCSSPGAPGRTVCSCGEPARVAAVTPSLTIPTRSPRCSSTIRIRNKGSVPPNLRDERGAANCTVWCFTPQFRRMNRFATSGFTL